LDPSVTASALPLLATSTTELQQLKQDLQALAPSPEDLRHSLFTQLQSFLSDAIDSRLKLNQLTQVVLNLNHRVLQHTFDPRDATPSQLKAHTKPTTSGKPKGPPTTTPTPNANLKPSTKAKRGALHNDESESSESDYEG
jgi:hypothetical protein